MARIDVDFLKPKANRKCASCFGTESHISRLSALQKIRICLDLQSTKLNGITNKVHLEKKGTKCDKEQTVFLNTR